MNRKKGCSGSENIFSGKNKPLKNSRLPRRKLFQRIIFSAAALLMLTGCSGGDEQRYHVYSDGTYIEFSEEHSGHSKKAGEAAFYVPDGMVTDYYSRNTLDDEEKELYDSILRDLGNMKEKVTLPDATSEYMKVLNLIRLEQLAYTQVSGWDYEYNFATQSLDTLVFRYRFTPDEISSMNIAVERAAKEIMDGITPGMDDYDKLKYFHDHLVKNCKASTNYEYADTIYGAIVKGEALCEGYTKAFSYLCNLAGIENMIVAGETYVPHTWNMVKLGGNWYHVDVTWDDPDDKLHEEIPGAILYQYFMVTDSVIENDHVIWTYLGDVPKANGRTENYFVREGYDASSEDEFFNAAENAISDAVSRGEQSAMVKCDTNDLYVSAVTDLSGKAGEIFDSIITRMNSAYGRNIRLSWTDYYGHYRIITFIIEYIE